MGFAGMANAMVGFTAFLSAGSVGDVLVQRGRYKTEAMQGMWVSLFLAIITALIILIMSPIMGWSGRPEIAGLLLVLAVSTVVGTPNTVLGATLKNNLDFKHMAISHLIEGIVFTSTSVLFACLGFGPYSLILPIIPRLMAGAGYVAWREGLPKFEWVRKEKIKALLKPTLALALTGFFVGLQIQGPIFFVGLVLNPASIGHFSWGLSIAGQAVFLLAINLRQVLMPVFVKMKENPDRQVRGVIKSMKIMTAILAVTCGLQALMAEPLLNYYFPEKWHPAGPVITWISIGLISQGVWVSISSWLNAIGKYRELLWTNVLPAILAALLATLGAKLTGAEGASIGMSIGLSTGILLALRYLPWAELKKNSMNFLIPFTITIMAWAVSIHYFGSSLGIRITAALFFVIVSVLSWWHWDDGTLRGFMGNRSELLK